MCKNEDNDLIRLPNGKVYRKGHLTDKDIQELVDYTFDVQVKQKDKMPIKDVPSNPMFERWEAENEDMLRDGLDF